MDSTRVYETLSIGSSPVVGVLGYRVNGSASGCYPESTGSNPVVPALLENRLMAGLLALTQCVLVRIQLLQLVWAQLAAE